MRIAWGLTGSGDKFRETYETMKKIKDNHTEVKMDLYLSKAAEQVSRFYRLQDELKDDFNSFMVEKNANTPFISGMLQTGKYDLLLIAPVTGNTVAKIASGIADSLISNAAIQAVKGFVPVYLMPVDFREGIVETIIPNGDTIKLRVRKEDAENVDKIRKMDGFHVFEDPSEILGIIKENMDK